MEYLSKIWVKTRTVLVSMPPSQRYTVAGLLILVGLALAMLVAGGGGAQYEAVLTDLSGSEMTAVQTALKSSQIEYRITNGVLWVKPAQKDKVFMVLAEKDALPSDISRSFGFEDLVQPKGFSLETEHEQKMKYNIALGNMLARAITTAPEIQSAQVHIASNSDGTIFGAVTATAAISIVPRTSQRISEAKLNAICRFVAAAVGPALLPEAVEIAVPATGQHFSPKDENSPYTMASNRLELTKAWDQYYSEAVQRFLRPAFGSVQTIVSPVIDATSRTTKETEYTVTHTTSKFESVTGGDGGGGETLVSANVGTELVASGAAAAGPSTENEESETSMSPGRETLTDTPPGQITDLQVSVLVDQRRLEAIIRDKKHLEADAEITQADIAAETDYWRSMLLALPVAGDASTRVSKVSFSATPYTELQVAGIDMVAASSGRLVASIENNWQRLALVCLAVVALFMIRSISKHVGLPEASASIVEADSEEDVDLPEVSIDIEQKRLAKMTRNIEEMIASDPQTAVSLIRRWTTKET